MLILAMAALLTAVAAFVFCAHLHRRLLAVTAEQVKLQAQIVSLRARREVAKTTEIVPSRYTHNRTSPQPVVASPIVRNGYRVTAL